MKYDAYIFDLDGTILDTLPDLVRLTNMVLEQRGMPPRTMDEINSFVGNGARVLLQKASAPGTSEQELNEILALWKSLYGEYGHAYTAPYEGMPEALNQLKATGAKLGVLSNKFDAAVRSVVAEHYPDVFDIARGECAEIPRKPDPQGLLFMMDQLGVSPERTAYVGDSGSDMVTAHAAGAFAVGVTWGYRPAGDLLAAGADVLIDSPVQLYNGLHISD